MTHCSATDSCVLANRILMAWHVKDAIAFASSITACLLALHFGYNSWFTLCYLCFLLTQPTLIRVQNMKLGISTVWPVAKFEQKLDKMRELFQVCLSTVLSLH